MLLELTAVLALACKACEERGGYPFGFPFAHKPGEGSDAGPAQPAAEKPTPAPQKIEKLAPDDATPVIRPKLIYRHAPRYPIEALKNDKEGWVTLKFQLAPDGVPFNPAIHASSDPVFDAPSLSAVVKCRYEAAPAGSNLYGGRWFYVRYKFQFEGTPIAPGGQLPDSSG